MQWTTLSGDPAVLVQFRGSWYDFEGIKHVEVDLAPPARLGLRLAPVFRVSEARTVEGEIHFTLSLGDVPVDSSLRFLADDEIFLVQPGEKPSMDSLCGPPPSYKRSSMPQFALRALRKAQEVGKEIRETMIEDLADVL